MKKFLFSMALALGAICMPSQANAAEVSSPVVNNIKATTTFQGTLFNWSAYSLIFSFYSVQI